MATATQLLTAEEYAALDAPPWSELIDGVVVELSPPGGGHGLRQAKLIGLLRDAGAGAHGVVLGEIGCRIRRRPDTVRAPDVAFIRAERVPLTGIPEGFWEGAPDLVVEIVSPSDRPGEIQTKIREWLEAGAQQVWVLYYANRTVEIVRSLLDRISLGPTDTLDGGDVVPGFLCRVADLFD